MMKLLVFLLFPYTLGAQSSMMYEARRKQPLGKLNPEAPRETGDDAPSSGSCDFTSSRRNPNQSRTEPQEMIWTLKYIMNGPALQNYNAKADGIESGSIRKFVVDSSRWYVQWSSNTSLNTVMPYWEGGNRGELFLHPNGMGSEQYILGPHVLTKIISKIGLQPAPAYLYTFPNNEPSTININYLIVT